MRYNGTWYLSILKGGHCMEMSQYCEGFPKEFKLSYFIIAKKDYLTIKKITDIMEKRDEKYVLLVFIGNF